MLGTMGESTPDSPIVPKRKEYTEAEKEANFKKMKLLKRNRKPDVTDIEVEVCNPMTRDKKIGKFVVYEVVGQDKNGSFNCQRRYNEFKELRMKLTENWPAIFIPPLPEKKKTVSGCVDGLEQLQHGFHQ